MGLAFGEGTAVRRFPYQGWNLLSFRQSDFPRPPPPHEICLLPAANFGISLGKQKILGFLLTFICFQAGCCAKMLMFPMKMKAPLD